MQTRTLRGRGRAAFLLLPIAAFVLGACSATAPTAGDPDPIDGRPNTDRSVMEPPAVAPDAYGGVSLQGAQAPDVTTADAADGALIIRTGQLELEVKDVATSVPKARALIGSLGGYVSASDETDHGDWIAAIITYRVPADRWQEAIDGLRGLSDRVVREATQAQEVTSQVVDLKARITNLRASETALIEIMDGSGSIEDVLAVQQRLSEVRGEIEQLVAQQQDLEGRAALATLTVTYASPVMAVATTAAGWDIGKVIDEAAAQTVAAGQGLVSALVWLLIVGLPVIVVPLLIVGGVLLLIRRRWAGRSLPTPTAGPDAPGGAAA